MIWEAKQEIIDIGNAWIGTSIVRGEICWRESYSGGKTLEKTMNVVRLIQG